MRTVLIGLLMLAGTSAALRRGSGQAHAAESVPPITIWEGTLPPETLSDKPLDPRIFLATGAALAFVLVLWIVIVAIRKRERPRFSLRWLLVFMLAFGTALYGGVRRWEENHTDSHTHWKARVRETFAERFSVDILDEEISGGIHDFHSQSHSRIYLVLNPVFATTTVSVNLENVTMAEALAELCRQLKAQWSVCNGAIFIYPADDPPPVQREQSKESWAAYAEGKLDRRMSLEFVDTTLNDGVTFIGSCTNVPVVVDASAMGEVPINLCPVIDMRADDALTCICVLSDTQWTLRKGSNGTAEIYITAREKKSGAPKSSK